MSASPVATGGRKVVGPVVARAWIATVSAAFSVAGLAQQPQLQKSVPTAAPTHLAVACPQSDFECVPPQMPREFRGVWVATVRNMDWPSSSALPPALQKSELIALLDRASSLGLNAVIMQVRPAGDALYTSSIEPWSEYLTGKQGLRPVPFWDPLAFAVKEAHARGLELHAWFNPYRAKDPGARSPLARMHIARQRPELVKRYGTQLWMDPGEAAIRTRTLRVVLDVVKRYDIDGVHVDDYFYPYPERRTNGSTDFPDDRSWKRYRKTGGKLDRNDWRRRNVDLLIEALHKAIRRTKPWVKFGVSPFGIWRPGYPETVRGFDAYEKLFADSRKWLREGWVDYLTPQLYWAMDKDGQRYPDLLRWWVAQDSLLRHVWPGNYADKVGEPGPNGWRRDEILAQVRSTRAQAGASGNVHFSMKVLLDNRDSLGTALQSLMYADPALVPASPWLSARVPGIPAAGLIPSAKGVMIRLTPSGKDVVRWWVVQLRFAGRWQAQVIDGARRKAPLDEFVHDSLMAPEMIAVTAVDRVGNSGQPVTLRIP